MISQDTRKCTRCGVQTEWTLTSVEMTDEHSSVTVTGVPAMVCPRCGEEYVPGLQAMSLTNAAEGIFSVLRGGGHNPSKPSHSHQPLVSSPGRCEVPFTVWKGECGWSPSQSEESLRFRVRVEGEPQPNRQPARRRLVHQTAERRRPAHVDSATATLCKCMSS